MVTHLCCVLLLCTQNWIFWGKTSNRSVYRIHKSQKVMHNEAAVKVVVNGLSHFNDIVVYHSLQQPQGELPLFQKFFCCF